MLVGDKSCVPFFLVSYMYIYLCSHVNTNLSKEDWRVNLKLLFFNVSGLCNYW